MKLSSVKKIIREEVKRVLNEDATNQTVVDIVSKTTLDNFGPKVKARVLHFKDNMYTVGLRKGINGLYDPRYYSMLADDLRNNLPKEWLEQSSVDAVKIGTGGATEGSIILRLSPTGIKAVGKLARFGESIVKESSGLEKMFTISSNRSAETLVQLLKKYTPIIAFAKWKEWLVDEDSLTDSEAKQVHDALFGLVQRLERNALKQKAAKAVYDVLASHAPGTPNKTNRELPRSNSSHTDTLIQKNKWISEEAFFNMLGDKYKKALKAMYTIDSGEYDETALATEYNQVLTYGKVPFSVSEVRFVGQEGDVEVKLASSKTESTIKEAYPRSTSSTKLTLSLIKQHSPELWKLIQSADYVERGSVGMVQGLGNKMISGVEVAGIPDSSFQFTVGCSTAMRKNVYTIVYECLIYAESGSRNSAKKQTGFVECWEEKLPVSVKKICDEILMNYKKSK